VLHLARYDRFLGWICVMCKASMEMIVTYGLDHGDDSLGCAGWVEPVNEKEQLEGKGHE
jgi:hypothetical protein